VTRNKDGRRITSADRNEVYVKNFAESDWRASLVPAAAVIPAPIAYAKVVAVKKLVVGFVAKWSVGRCA